ncbi:WAT1-related protein [Hibiscus syriacus]|uniref:WAT1-related protein n=1 Tax=Hibiscus syriacus TaxID=106335 RepID=A0A6A3B817_HIBSY|nr:WAT1-related protein [Hibiscus syriacus]
MNEGICTKKGADLNNGEMTYDTSSRVDPKRSNQLFMDGTETDLFPNKKQAVGIPTINLFSGIFNPNESPWGNASGFTSISEQFAERFFNTETARAMNFDDRSFSSGNTEKALMGRKVNEDLFISDSSFGLSMSHTLEDPRSGLNFGGIRKVKVSEVKDSDNIMSASMGYVFNRVDNNSVSTDHAYNKVEDGIMSMGFPYNKGDSIGDTYERENNLFKSMGQSHSKIEDNSAITISDTFEKGDNNFMLWVKPTTGQMIVLFNAPSAKELVQTNNIIASRAEVSRKKDEPKTSKKAASNNFPSNVKSLLSTGMLDGVPVKYIAWSQEKELRGVIKSSGYQCGCQTCSFSKVINAYEFERHAGCKTKHPNNHIYFENGKTVYGIVQELRSTPQNMLFDVIQTITGSPINQKCFRLWKGNVSF